MRIPRKAPDFKAKLAEILQKADEPEKISRFFAEQANAIRGKYLHWDELRLRPAPEGLTHEEWWAAVAAHRFAMSQQTPFVEKSGTAFRFSEPGQVKKLIHEIDSEARGGLAIAKGVINETASDRYLMRSLVEEPFSSSVLEGAATTRRAAKSLINEGRDPIDESERMVLNNYLAMKFVKEQAKNDLTPEMVFELHRIVTSETLKDERKAGAFRAIEDEIVVEDRTTQEPLHIPPHADELEERLTKLCAFANRSTDDTPFIHPLIHACILHFMMGYDHPFVDGNGRTARALFYWAALRQGYWIFEFVSISRSILDSSTQYARAYLHSETDHGDLTYFLIYHLRVLQKGIDALHGYLNQKTKDLGELQDFIDANRFGSKFNFRQLRLLEEAIENEDKQFTIAEHAFGFGVSYLTARQDLERLHLDGLLQKSKLGRTSVYQPTRDLLNKLNSDGSVS